MKTPKIGSEPQPAKIPKIADSPAAYKSHYPSWQISLIDFEGEWGLNYLNGKIKFSFNDELLALLGDHTEIFNVLDQLDGKVFEDIHVFFRRVHEALSVEIPNSINKEILQCLSRHVFMEEVYPKLKEYERITWYELESQTYGKRGKTKHHTILVQNLTRDARQRLAAIRLDDIEEVFSLRLDGKFRIYGIRKFGYLQIIWFDQDHTAYDFSD